MVTPSELLLITEDNDTLREGLREMLSIEGFSVITARNGREALELLEKNTPALILSDIAMPVMDGIELYKSVRSRPDWITVPFVFLTAKTERLDILAGKTLGVDDYLTKPISREELVTTIFVTTTKDGMVKDTRIIWQGYLFLRKHGLSPLRTHSIS